jgi:hypothetical protein
MIELDELDVIEYQPKTSFLPNRTITFFGLGQKQIGQLDFNGPTMTFEGDAEESARLFFMFIIMQFNRRLEEEREAGWNQGYEEANRREGEK